MFGIPFTASGADAQGNPFKTTGRTVALSRHGARVQARHELQPRQVIHVANQLNHAEADFRVVGPLVHPGQVLCDWGIECLGKNETVWGVRFPQISQDSEARALLQCGRCHTLALQPLSLVEVEVLETAGLLSKPCPECEASTPWGYPERAFEVESKVFEAAAAPGETSPLEADRRNVPRQTVQLPARVRNYYGETEVVRTENHSREGLCFVTDREYLVGQGILVICPYEAGDRGPELSAHIVREGSAGMPARRLYGARYDHSIR